LLTSLLTSLLAPLLTSLLTTLLTSLLTSLLAQMFGGMGLHYEATTPQFVTTQNSAAASAAGPADQFVWHSAAKSAALPSMNNATKKHSPWAQFSATCMYFGAELITARAGGADADVPVGLIQSAIGGSQIESWMDNKTLLECKNQSLTGGAIPQDAGALYYGMVAPFANYSVAGWVWCTSPLLLSALPMRLNRVLEICRSGREQRAR